MMALTDNNVILFGENKNLQEERLEGGWLSQKEMCKRISFTTWMGFRKREKLTKEIQKEKWFWTFIGLKADTDMNEVFQFIHLT
jgi:hypothetical protein